MRSVEKVGNNCSDGSEQLQPLLTTSSCVDFLDRWLSIKMANVGKHVLLICTENPDAYDDIIDEIRVVVRSHYVAPEVTAERLAELGAPETAKLLREHLPTREGDRTQSIQGCL